ncbi:MAG: type II toxin-antitoxin system HipA family toxin [Bilophila wadsworthia]
MKFPARHDDPAIGRMEYACSLAAKRAGIEMPETALFPGRDGAAYFGVRRFDREDGGKVHVHTACGLLHASHRYASLDYENLFRLGKSLTRNPEDVEKLIRLMAFNVRLGNQDDHSKNFSFLLDAKGRWRLAPAYDLTPSRGVGEQTCMVNGKGRDITDKDMIAAASVVDVPARTVRPSSSRSARP